MVPSSMGLYLSGNREINMMMMHINYYYRQLLALAVETMLSLFPLLRLLLFFGHGVC